MAKDILTRLVMLKGESGAVIESIEILSSSGATDIMRITLSDGSTVDFPVTNTLDDDHIKDVIGEVTTEEVDQSGNPVASYAVYEALVEKDYENQWHEIGTKAPLDSSWTSISFDVTDFMSKAYEFLVVISLQASDSSLINVAITIPNVEIVAQTAGSQDYIGGYYYSASYNGSVMARFNRTAKTIAVLKSWTQVTGSSIDVGQVELFYRGKR